MKNYKELVLVDDTKVILDGKNYDAVLGKHCLWIPEIESKFIISLNGRPESIAWQRGLNKELIESNKFIAKNRKEIIDTLNNEHGIFSLLAKKKMSPQPGEQIRIKVFISSIFYPNYADTKSIYGFKFPDANKLPPGNWNFEKFKQLFIDTGLIKASPGALGDLNKEGNVVNKYLIDVRRTIWDMMRINT